MASSENSIESSTIQSLSTPSKTNIHSPSIPSTPSTPSTPSSQSTSQITFLPWSYPAFLDRLKTYNIRSWTDVECQRNGELLSLTPVDCAAIGWIAIKQTGRKEDISGGAVQCVTCFKILNIMIPELKTEDNEKIEDELERKFEITKRLILHFKTQLIEHHHSTCPWRLLHKNKNNDQTQENIYYRRFNGKGFSSDVINAYEEKKKALEEILSPEKAVVVTTNSSMNHSETIKTAIRVYAAMGWSLLDQKTSNSALILKCDACFRHILLKRSSDGDTNKIEIPFENLEEFKKELESHHAEYCGYLYKSSIEPTKPFYEKFLDKQITGDYLKMFLSPSTRLSAHLLRKNQEDLTFSENYVHDESDNDDDDDEDNEKMMQEIRNHNERILKLKKMYATRSSFKHPATPKK